MSFIFQGYYWYLSNTNTFNSEEEEPEEHFPLTLRTRKMTERAASPLDSISVNGREEAETEAGKE